MNSMREKLFTYVISFWNSSLSNSISNQYGSHGNLIWNLKKKKKKEKTIPTAELNWHYKQQLQTTLYHHHETKHLTKFNLQQWN